MNWRAIWIGLALICLLGLTSCASSSSGNGGGGGGGGGEAITATSGTPQSVAVNTAFAPLMATVTTNGNPTSGVVVTFTAPAATGASGTFAGGVNTATTGPGGVASVNFTANAIAGGPYIVIASISGVTTTAHFQLTNTAGAAASVQAAGGTPQSATISTPFASQLTVVVVDSNNNPVNKATVTFTAPTSGASGTFAGGTNTAPTDQTGTAVSQVFTANSKAGTYNVVASVSGATSADFSLTNTAGAPASVSATTGTPQSANLSTAFSAPLVATVLDSGGNPVSGATVTFAPPASGASGAFAGGVNMATTGTNGEATSPTFTANTTTGTYNVAASVTGATMADFALTNTAPTGTRYSFYLSGLEFVNSGPNFYALAGSVAIDSNGNVTGEQDYNDGFGLTSPQPSGDAILGGSLSVSKSTGQGTLILITNNPNLGVLNNELQGVETFAVQFVNSNHALITQFDGTATSSGSLDLQSLPSTLSGGYAFTLSGVDQVNYDSIVYGGVFTTSGSTLSGTYDVDDFGANTTPTLNQTLTGTVSAADYFGRGTITTSSLTSNPTLVPTTTLNYYIVGPEAIRIIDVDNTFGVNGDSMIGSAFGQGSVPFSDTSLGSSVFGLQSNWFGGDYAVAGMFTTDTGAATFQGVADDNELQDSFQAASPSTIAGSYSISGNGYGNLTITAGDLGDVSVLGIYMTDPKLNLSDPNNTTSGLGGALVVDLDGFVLNGSGIVIPQITGSLVGNYAFGAQEFNLGTTASPIGGEFDFVGQGSINSSLALSGTGLVSDPWDFFTTPNSGTDSGVTFSGTLVADGSNPGRYTMTPLSTPSLSRQGGEPPFSVVIYQATGIQASGGELFWLQTNSDSVFLGSLQQQGDLSGIPAAAKVAANPASEPKQ